jgi:hypothetical protein
MGPFAGALAAISYVPYIIDILRHEPGTENLSSSWLNTGLYMSKNARPERFAWLIWSLAASMAFFSQLQLGLSASLWFTGANALGAILVFLLSLRYGYGGLMKRDLMGLLIIVAGAGTAIYTQNALYALLLAIAAEAVGSGLTIWKIFEHPNHETYPTWLLLLAASLLAVASVSKPSLAQLAYPLYAFLFTGAIVLSIFIGRRIRSRWANVE